MSRMPLPALRMVRSIHFDGILNRKDFSYDMNNDQMYQQYRDAYMRQGQQAMRDTMGAASALTGGYGSTYAQTAGSQAYGSVPGGTER